MSNPEQKSTFIFPGQGSQYPGIGSDLHAEFDSVKQIYQEASDVLGYDMADLSFNDPKDQVNLTRYTQPVLLTHHIACLTLYRELAENPVQPFAAAGHSLGEYSALVAAESLSFADALRLVSKRGELMGTYGEGEMMALTVDLESAKPLSDKHYCGIAGLNLPDQTVVGGAGTDLDALAEEMAELYPKKKAVRLKTEGAFHTYYMVEAARRFRDELKQVEFASPKLMVPSNFSGDFHDDSADSIRARLFFQLFHPVNWVGCMQSVLDAGVELFIEFGGGIGSGDGPAEKRANLEGIIKKFTRRADPRPEHRSAINLASIKQTAGIE
jgi:[acyl-carrier-protein] S-malonyltransferase